MRWATFVDTKATEKQKLNTTKRGWWDTSYAIPGSLCRWWPNTARLSGETLMCVCVCDVITSEVRCPPSHPSVFSWPHWMQFPEHHALPPFEKILIKTWSPNGGLNDVKLKPEQEMPGVKVFPKQGLYFTSTLTTLGARKIETIFFLSFQDMYSVHAHYARVLLWNWNTQRKVARLSPQLPLHFCRHRKLWLLRRIHHADFKYSTNSQFFENLCAVLLALITEIRCGIVYRPWTSKPNESSSLQCRIVQGHRI